VSKLTFRETSLVLWSRNCCASCRTSRMVAIFDTHLSF